MSDFSKTFLPAMLYARPTESTLKAYCETFPSYRLDLLPSWQLALVFADARLDDGFHESVYVSTVKTFSCRRLCFDTSKSTMDRVAGSFNAARFFLRGIPSQILVFDSLRESLDKTKKRMCHEGVGVDRDAELVTPDIPVSFCATRNNLRVKSTKYSLSARPFELKIGDESKEERPPHVGTFRFSNKLINSRLLPVVCEEEPPAGFKLLYRDQFESDDFCVAFSGIQNQYYLVAALANCFNEPNVFYRHGMNHRFTIADIVNLNMAVEECFDDFVVHGVNYVCTGQPVHSVFYFVRELFDRLNFVQFVDLILYYPGFADLVTSSMSGKFYVEEICAVFMAVTIAHKILDRWKPLHDLCRTDAVKAKTYIESIHRDLGI
jgi:hypothetical protein